MARKVRPPLRYIPQKILDVVAELREVVGHEATFAQIRRDVWRVTMENDRVLMYVDFRRTWQGNIRWKGSKLFVDGRERPIADSMAHFAEIFTYPPDGLPKPPEGQIEPMPPERGIGEAPEAVYTQYAKMAQAVKLLGERGADLALSVGYALGRWSFSMAGTLPDGRPVEVRFRFIRDGKGHWVGENCGRAVQFVVDGVDRTEESGGQAERILEIMFGSGDLPPELAAPTPRPHGRPPGARSKSAAAPNSVQVRKASVRRV